MTFVDQFQHNSNLSATFLNLQLARDQAAPVTQIVILVECSMKWSSVDSEKSSASWRMAWWRLNSWSSAFLLRLNSSKSADAKTTDCISGDGFSTAPTVCIKRAFVAIFCQFRHGVSQHRCSREQNTSSVHYTCLSYFVFVSCDKSSPTGPCE